MAAQADVGVVMVIFWVCVAGELLENSDVGSGFKEMRGEGVAAPWPV